MVDVVMLLRSTVHLVLYCALWERFRGTLVETFQRKSPRPEVAVNE